MSTLKSFDEIFAPLSAEEAAAAAQVRALFLPGLRLVHTLEIAPDGTITTLHSDEVAPLVVGAGDATIARASHVEPDGLRWSVAHADGTDTGKRFDTRAEALAWEREHWRELCGCEGGK